MCKAHWRKVAPHLQRAVWDGYRPGQCDDKRPSKAWLDAADAAIRFCSAERREACLKERTTKKYFTTAIDYEDDGFGFTCDACAEAKCAVCGHEPCSACRDCCDHFDCLVRVGDSDKLQKTHTCVFTACDEHRPPEEAKT
jgi:hypothetical protein